MTDEATTGLAAVSYCASVLYAFTLAAVSAIHHPSQVGIEARASCQMRTGVAAPSGGRDILVCDHQPHRVGKHARGILGLGLSMVQWSTTRWVWCGGCGGPTAANGGVVHLFLHSPALHNTHPSYHQHAKNEKKKRKKEKVTLEMDWVEWRAESRAQSTEHMLVYTADAARGQDMNTTYVKKGPQKKRCNGRPWQDAGSHDARATLLVGACTVHTCYVQYFC